MEPSSRTVPLSLCLCLSPDLSLSLSRGTVYFYHVYRYYYCITYTHAHPKRRPPRHAQQDLHRIDRGSVRVVVVVFFLLVAFSCALAVYVYSLVLTFSHSIFFFRRGMIRSNLDRLEILLKLDNDFGTFPVIQFFLLFVSPYDKNKNTGFVLSVSLSTDMFDTNTVCGGGGGGYVLSRSGVCHASSLLYARA